MSVFITLAVGAGVAAERSNSTSPVARSARCPRRCRGAGQRRGLRWNRCAAAWLRRALRESAGRRVCGGARRRAHDRRGGCRSKVVPANTAPVPSSTKTTPSAENNQAFGCFAMSAAIPPVPETFAAFDPRPATSATAGSRQQARPPPRVVQPRRAGRVEGYGCRVARQSSGRRQRSGGRIVTAESSRADQCVEPHRRRSVLAHPLGWIVSRHHEQRPHVPRGGSSAACRVSPPRKRRQTGRRAAGHQAMPHRSGLWGRRIRRLGLLRLTHSLMITGELGTRVGAVRVTHPGRPARSGGASHPGSP